MEPQSWIIGTAGAVAFATLVASAQAAAITSMMSGIKTAEEVFTPRRVAQRYCWRRHGRRQHIYSEAQAAGLVPEGHNPTRRVQRFSVQARQRFPTGEELARQRPNSVEVCAK
jgi:hypothetical protein